MPRCARLPLARTTPPLGTNTAPIHLRHGGDFCVSVDEGGDVNIPVRPLKYLFTTGLGEGGVN